MIVPTKPSVVTARFMKAICSAGERCSCADGNWQWRSPDCCIIERHAEAIAALPSLVRQRELIIASIETLTPLAKIADLYADQEDDGFQIFNDCDLPEVRSLTLGQCRKAKQMLQTGPDPQPLA